MKAKYDHNKIESKWKDQWYDAKVYEAIDFDPKPKKYILAELPYPSGKALHAGHMMRFTVPDIYARYLRMKGNNVLFPIGWDAFGLPAENYAIKTGIHPAKLTQETVVHYKESIRRIGYGIDWDRVIDTTDPNYYKWTQWIFLKFFKEGLAKYEEMPIWWCDALKTVLSDEEVLTDKNGNKISERGEHPVERKMFKQWVLEITKYAEKLLEGLGEIDFPDSIKLAQENWIGKSEGANIRFKVGTEQIEVFTTRPDTIYGVTFLVLSPEHPIVHRLLGTATNKEEVLEYIKNVSNRSDMERAVDKDKTGVEIKGVTAAHPITGKSLPIFIADYVLMDYGTGAIMAVPAHDERDFAFAKKYNIEIIEVIKTENETLPSIGEGVMLNSGEYNGLSSKEFSTKIIKKLEDLGAGKAATTYKMRDWVFSRQRYWGEPIPLIHKQNGTIEPICDPDNPSEVAKALPLELPDVPDYNPTSDGSSPLEKNKEWVKTTAKDGSPAKRETNTMPNWAGSCWYYIRYLDPKNNSAFADPKKLKYWLPVDRYFGGAEHTTMHLLYSRFWHRFLFDQGLVPTKEPYAWRMNGGLLLGPDGKKMSKSRGNVVEPIDLMDKYGADALRLFIAFLGPYEETYPWNDNGIKATKKFIDTVYSLKFNVSADAPSEETVVAYNKMVKNITRMVDELKMNTCVSELMIFVNHLKTLKAVNNEIWKGFVRVLAPFAPFIAEELWSEINNASAYSKEQSVHLSSWPTFDDDKTRTAVTEIPVQINGKFRGLVPFESTDTEDTLKEKVLNAERFSQHLGGKPIKKLIVVANKIINVIN